MTSKEIIEQSIIELFPSTEQKGGGELVTSGVAFDYISGMASKRESKTIAVVRAFVDEDESVSTPIVLDHHDAGNMFVFTQDSDNVVATREQLVSLRAAIDLALGE